MGRDCGQQGQLYKGMEARTGLGGLECGWGTVSHPWEPSKALEQGSNNHSSLYTFFKQFHRKSYSSQRRALCRKQMSSLPPPKRASWLRKQFLLEDSNFIMSAIQPKCHLM